MKYLAVEPPRRFTVGRRGQIELSDCARLVLGADEQVTFVTERGAEFDVARKSWGFYATPSLNSRLRRFGFRSALVRNGLGHYFVLLVEDRSMDSFIAYLEEEKLTVVTWLDGDDPLQGAIEAMQPASPCGDEPSTCCCGADRWDLAHIYRHRPDGETEFLPRGTPYRRELWRCRACAHIRSVHEMLPNGFYRGSYMQATYAEHGIREAFERIVALDRSRSDNAGRVARITSFLAPIVERLNRAPTVLDVGSGLCVFLHAMKEAGWDCTALDPDEAATRHAEGIVGVKAICADFREADARDVFDLVTFNRVLEHVEDPVAMLRGSRSVVGRHGWVYVEVPDGERAIEDGPHREEFFIEHAHAFSLTSMCGMIERAGLRALWTERVHEPSGKYTLRAMCLCAKPREQPA